MDTELRRFFEANGRIEIPEGSLLAEISPEIRSRLLTRYREYVLAEGVAPPNPGDPDYELWVQHQIFLGM